MLRIEGNYVLQGMGSKCSHARKNDLNEENIGCGKSYGQRFSGIDIDYTTYIRETVPKTTWEDNYFKKLWEEHGNYLKGIRQEQGSYEFDDVAMGAAQAYSVLYQKIVEGYENGTREVYVCDCPESGERRLLSKDEELEKLDRGFEELVQWEQMAMKSRVLCEQIKEKYQGEKEDNVVNAKEICDYLQNSYLDFRSLYLEQYEKKGGVTNTKNMISSILQRNPKMYSICQLLFSGTNYVT